MRMVSLVDHTYMEQLARRVLLILMDNTETGEMSVAELDKAHNTMFGFPLDVKGLCEELQEFVQVREKIKKIDR